MTAAIPGARATPPHGARALPEPRPRDDVSQGEAPVVVGCEARGGTAARAVADGVPLPVRRDHSSRNARRYASSFCLLSAGPLASAIMAAA